MKPASLSYEALRKRVLGASTYLILAQVVRVLLNYASIAILVRALGLRDLGIYFMLNEVGRIGSLVAQAGFTQSTQKFLGRMVYNQAGSLPAVQRRMWLLVLATTFAVVVVCFVFWSLAVSKVTALHDLGDLALFGGVMIVVRTFNTYAASVLRAIDKMVKSVLSLDLLQKFGFLVAVCLMAALASGGIDLYVVLIAWTATGLASVLVSIALVMMEMRQMRRQHALDAADSLPSYRELLLTSLPMGVGSGLATLRNSADVLIAGAVLGPAAAGIYGPCRMLANLITFVLQAVRGALPAAVAAAWPVLPKPQVESLLRKAANYGACAAVPLAAILIIAGGWILHVGFGDKLEGYGVLLTALTAGPLVGSLLGVPGPVLQVLGHHTTQMAIVVVVTVTSLITMPFVAHGFGLTGMGAVASVMVVVQDAALCTSVYVLFRMRSYVSPGMLYGRSNAT